MRYLQTNYIYKPDWQIAAGFLDDNNEIYFMRHLKYNINLKACLVVIIELKYF